MVGVALKEKLGANGDAPVPEKEELESRLGELRTDLSRLVHRIDLHQKPETTEPVAQAPKIPPRLRETEELIHSIDEEIRRVDHLLADVAARERKLKLEGFEELGEPYRSAEFTLYARTVSAKSGETLVKYFFAEEPPINAVAVPLPEGYEVEIDAKTGKRSLRRVRQENP
jgi:hypothetical protein